MEISTIGVVGCGLMGAGIAEVAALAGFEVVALKVTGHGSLDQAKSRIRASMNGSVAKKRLTEQGRDDALARITLTTDRGALAGCQLVIECTAENLDAKKRLLFELEPVLASDAILATNTSSLPLAELVGVLKYPQRFLGLHFFSPAPAMKLVEVAPTAQTATAVSSASFLAVERLGKIPIPVTAKPGYVVNRLLVPYLCHAIETLERGIARAKDIDMAMKLGCGHPIGPLALADLIGLDIVLAMAETLTRELGDTRFTPPDLLRRLCQAGHCGKKANLGFYDYRGKEPVENPEVVAGQTQEAHN